MARLEKNGKTDGAPAALVDGRLAIVAPQGSPVKVDGDLAGLKQALADGSVKHISIAVRDRALWQGSDEALEEAGLLEKAKPLFVQGENIGQAAQFVTTAGAAEVGLVAQSLLFAPDVASKVTQAPVNPSCTSPFARASRC